MRIISGELRGRRLAVPRGLAARPSAARVREALFNMLLHAPWAEPIEGARVLDAFAGTGALGLEALSRGAAEAVFFEADAEVRRVLAANIETCRMDARARVIAADATRPSPGGACGLVFLDPPYGEGLVGRAFAALERRGWIAPGATIVAETGRKETLEGLGVLLAERCHGAARLSFWRRE